MGADNWATCPKCRKKAIKEKENLEKQAKESYGKVSELQYVEILKKAQEDINLDNSLRENYEFDMDDGGTFSASYRAHCNCCGFIYEFEHNEKVTI